nr:preprotein translocase subunit YajC [Nocardioides flavescens]
MPFVGLALIFWLLLIRPQQRRQRELASMQSSLGVGDEVVLTSGVYGTIRSLDDEGGARIEIADGVTIRVVRAAIGQVVRGDDTDDTDDTGVANDVSEES